MNGNTLRFRAAFSKSRSKAKTLVTEATPPVVADSVPAPKPPVSRIARQLALAYHVESLVESGALRDYAAAATRLRISRARMTQVMNLLGLAPAVQERILMGALAVPERRLRSPP